MTTHKLQNKSLKFWIVSSTLALLFVVICVFTFVNTKDIFLGVKIDAQIQENGSRSFSQVSGVAKHATKLVLNGREISIDKDGNFTEALALPDGYSIITIEANDAFGGNTSKSLEVYTIHNKSVAVENINSNIFNN